MGDRYVSFILGTERYCVPVAQVLQILRHEKLLEIPKAPPFVEGVINLRGDIIPVVNLKKRLELPEETRERKKERIIITQVGSRCYGLAVDEVREIVEIDEASFQGEAASLVGAHADCTRGVARHEDTLFLLLDLSRVLSVGREAPAAGPS